MNRKVIITCALTGAGDTVGKSEHVPVTPQQIAESGIEAARAGAAVVHVHVRDPRTGDGTREVALYREVVERLRDSGVDMVINTTAGMGGDLYLDPDDLSGFAEGTDLVNGIERLAHVAELLPDICTLDCGSLNFGEGSLVYVSTPDMLRAGAKRIQELGVRPELEIFDTGHLWFANKLVAEGLIDTRRCTSCAWASPTARRPSPRCWRPWPRRSHRGWCGPRSRSGACRCRGWRSRCCSAGTCGSAWRTTSTSAAQQGHQRPACRERGHDRHRDGGRGRRADQVRTIAHVSSYRQIRAAEGSDDRPHS